MLNITANDVKEKDINNATSFSLPDMDSWFNSELEKVNLIEIDQLSSHQIRQVFFRAVTSYQAGIFSLDQLPSVCVSMLKISESRPDLGISRLIDVGSSLSFYERYSVNNKDLAFLLAKHLKSIFEALKQFSE
jgi:hypothetical protein